MLTLIKKIARKTGALGVYHNIYRARREFLQNKDRKRYAAPEGAGYYCIGCGKYWTRFKPLHPSLFSDLRKNGWPYQLDDAETLNYENYSCYNCNMSDRERLYAMYLERTAKGDRPYSLVDFAPSKPLSDFIKQFKNITYRTSDLFMEGVDDKLDIQDLHSYKNEQFDIFICSHVLEHVDDDNKAIRELYRITKKGGWGIAMVPIINVVELTHEDPGIKNEGLRMKYFGQSDHVRLYAKDDFIERLKNAGFSVSSLDVSWFGKEAFEKNGITSKSILYIAHK